MTVQQACTQCLAMEGKKCYACDGKGWFSPPNEEAIRRLCFTKHGLRSTRPRDTTETACGHSQRAYYVWRMARFHGGKDVTMPVMAALDVRGDPYVKELDALADAVAKEAFGTDKAAAVVWGRVLGYL